MHAPRLTSKQIYDSPLIATLQQDLANAWVLYANYKHYHWQAYGPSFHDLHLMFDEFADQVFDTIDDFAERIRRLGADVTTITLTQFQQAASVQSSVANQSMLDMIEEAHANLLLVIQGMRDAARVADDNNDPGSVDLYSKIVQVHEKAEWFLRQALQARTGLTL